MVIEWQACQHIRYVSDDGDQSGWQWIQVTCPECGCIGANVVDGVVSQ